MIITKNSNALEFLSTLLSKNTIALEIYQTKTEGHNRSNYLLQLAKFFTFCLLAMVLFTACKKEEDLLPSASTANMNDAYLKGDAPTYYVAPTGSDANGDGTYAKPWASLYKASQMVTTSGSTIHIAAGIYTESHSCSLAVGVNVNGDGASTTIINGTYGINRTTDLYNMSNGTLALISTGGTDGNQTISNLTLDGGSGLTGDRAIMISNRSHVIITHCVIKNFFRGGVAFHNSGSMNVSLPANWDVGNEVSYCTIDNCGDTDATWLGQALIFMTCQQDLLIHDNLFYSNKRSGEHNGNIINAGSKHFKGVKYYNNTSYKPDPTYSGWNFHLEMWTNDGGFEIYSNTFVGGGNIIDCAGSGDSYTGYDYSYSIHDNVFRPNNPDFMPSSSIDSYAIHMEGAETAKTLIYNNSFSRFYTTIDVIAAKAQDIYIYDNTFNTCVHLFTSRYRNWGVAGPYHLNNLNIYRNKFYSARTAGGSYYGAIQLVPQVFTVTDVNIYNNTMVTSNLFYQPAVEITNSSAVRNVNIKNNIFEYFKNGGPMKFANTSTFAGLDIENNLSYNTSNYNSLPIFTGNTVTSYTYTNNLPTSNTTQVLPLFVNEGTQDFTLQATSPALNTGQIVSVDGTNLPDIGAAPDRGYIEYVEGGGTGPTIVLGTVSMTDNVSYPIVDASSIYAPCDVLTDGGGIISERGLVWNTSANPTIANNKVAMGAGVGHFSPYVEGLNSNTTYYFRSYCTNEAGTAYSNEVVKYKFSEGVTIDTSNAIQPIVIPDQPYDRKESRDKRDSLFKTDKDG